MVWNGKDETDVELGEAATQDTIHDTCIEYVFYYSIGETAVSKCRGLPASAAPRWTIRPYITWGYREPMSLIQCLKSLWYCHNETGNVWTHLVGLFIFVGFFVEDFIMSKDDLHHRLITGAYLLATMFCMLASSLFHLLGPISKTVYDNALRFDLTGIALVIMASFFVGLHYGYWCHVDLGRIYFIIVGILSLVALTWPYIPMLFNNFNLSVCFFASFVAFALVPLFHWVYLVGGLHSEQAELFLYKLLATFGLYALGFVFYSTQLWHLCVLAGALEFYTAQRAYVDYRVAHTCPVG